MTRTHSLNSVREIFGSPHTRRDRSAVHAAKTRKNAADGFDMRRVTAKFGFKYLLQLFFTSAPLLMADFFAVCLACGVTIAASSLLGLDAIAVREMVFLGGVSLLMQPVIWLAVGLYPGVGLSVLDEFRLSSIASSLWVAFLVAVNLTAASNLMVVATTLGLVFPLVLAAVPLCRLVARSAVAGSTWWAQPVVIFGGGAEAAAVYRRLSAAPSRGLRPIGIIDDLHAHWDDRHIEPAWYLGPPSAARRIADRFGVFWGIVALGNRSAEEVPRLLDTCAASIPHMIVLLDGSAALRSWDGARDCGGLQGLRINERLLLPMPRSIKRALDLLVTGVGGFLLLPLFAALALAVKFSSPGPIFYSQSRIGMGGQRFRAWKFRSMVTNADALLADYLEQNPHLQAEWESTHKLKRDPRITSIGRLLRKTSLDELPQLWNVLRGDMSLVGPRPIVEKEIAKYDAAYDLYLRVRPGITGLWQISGRNDTPYKERIRLDMSYVRNWSPWLDLYIMARTIRVVIFCEGAY